MMRRITSTLIMKHYPQKIYLRNMKSKINSISSPSGSSLNTKKSTLRVNIFPYIHFFLILSCISNAQVT
jgi:hypothetical protein